MTGIFHAICVGVGDQQKIRKFQRLMSWYCPSCEDSAFDPSLLRKRGHCPQYKLHDCLPRKRRGSVATKKAKVSTEETFCICQEPDDGSQYIQCDSCNLYYHPGCILDEEADIKAALEAEHWDCFECKQVEPVKPVALFCKCQLPRDNNFYLSCAACHEWFHPSCLGMNESEEKVAKEKELYKCPDCFTHDRPMKRIRTKAQALD